MYTTYHFILVLLFKSNQKNYEMDFTILNSYEPFLQLPNYLYW